MKNVKETPELVEELGRKQGFPPLLSANTDRGQRGQRLDTTRGHTVRVLQLYARGFEEMV